MAKIKELLHWNLLYTVFKSNSQRLITYHTKGILTENISQLNKIASQQPNNSMLPKQELLEEIYNKFKALEHESVTVLLENFTKKEVRLLVWSLDYKGEDSILFSAQFSKFISLVNEYWRDSYIIPLWYVLLKNWVSLRKNTTRFKEYILLFKKKCEEYDKSRKDVLAIKTHFNFWDQGGISAFVEYLYSKNIQINNACKNLNLNTNILGTDYYYESFTLYLKSIQAVDVSDVWVEDILTEIKIIKNNKYKLLLLGVLITNSKFSSQIGTIQKIAFECIGDPVAKRYWSNSHLNEKESELVESARKKLIVLMNKKLIKLFFSKLVQDPRRKTYWLKFIKEIVDIKFVGNRLNYNILKNNQEISKYVDARYKITRRNQSTSAIVIWARDYVFVEFSDTGAVYIYKKESFTVKLNHIEQIEDLKTWQRGNAVIKSGGSNYYNLQPEGTHAHMGESWEIRLDVWMNKYFYN